MFTFWMLIALVRYKFYNHNFLHHHHHHYHLSPSITIIRSSVAIDAICTFAGDGNSEVTGEVKKASNFKHFEGISTMKTIMHRLIYVAINSCNLHFPGASF